MGERRGRRTRQPWRARAADGRLAMPAPPLHDADKAYAEPGGVFWARRAPAALPTSLPLRGGPSPRPTTPRGPRFSSRLSQTWREKAVRRANGPPHAPGAPQRARRAAASAAVHRAPCASVRPPQAVGHDAAWPRGGYRVAGGGVGRAAAAARARRPTLAPRSRRRPPFRRPSRVARSGSPPAHSRAPGRAEGEREPRHALVPPLSGCPPPPRAPPVRPSHVSAHLLHRLTAGD